MEQKLKYKIDKQLAMARREQDKRNKTRGNRGEDDEEYDSNEDEDDGSSTLRAKLTRDGTAVNLVIVMKLVIVTIDFWH